MARGNDVTGLEKLYSEEEVQRYLRVSYATLRRWRQAGKLRAFQPGGGKLLYRHSDIQRLFDEPMVTSERPSRQDERFD